MDPFISSRERGRLQSNKLCNCFDIHFVLCSLSRGGEEREPDHFIITISVSKPGLSSGASRLLARLERIYLIVRQYCVGELRLYINLSSPPFMNDERRGEHIEHKRSEIS